MIKRMLDREKIKSFVMDIVNGKGSIEESFKFGLVIEITRGVHILLLIVFACTQILPAFIYNLFIICWYSFAREQVKKERYMLSFYMAYVEIMMNTFVMTDLLGRGSGFPLYNMLIVPLAFYLSYSLVGIWNRFIKPFILASLSFLEFVLMYIWADKLSGQYEIVGSSVDIFYILNTFIVFASMVCFVSYFVIEINGKRYELQQQNEELEKLANFDPLTDLRNRRSMLQKISTCQEKYNDFALILCDIDNFKQINDTYGHECGDAVLCNVAQVIKDNCLEGYFCARWGGEEFLILVPGIIGAAIITAETIRSQVENITLRYAGIDICCTMTFGVAAYRQGEPIVKTTARADKRLYYGKENGKNCVIS